MCYKFSDGPIKVLFHLFQLNASRVIFATALRSLFLRLKVELSRYRHMPTGDGGGAEAFKINFFVCYKHAVADWPRCDDMSE